ncbi:ATP-binding protein [uncultured Limosilactobacillus sp.]|uniref:ATP-binding protein n=1 Tax=uncultured Limosilactobacillus sp. TaxID=2837629 RepID=UPI0025E992E3|nr:ATP-binding protein [uncultured Limosilactobacillus sp.]
MTVINCLRNDQGDHPAMSLETLSAGHLLVVGQTGSGKTTTTLSLLDQLNHAATAVIVLDPTGEYQALPGSQHYVVGQNCFLDAGSWSGEELLTALRVSHDERQRELVDRAIQSLRIELNIHQRRGIYRKIGRSSAEFLADARRLGEWAQSYPVALLADQLVEEMVVPFENQRADYHLLGQQYDHQLISQQWQFISTLRQRLASHDFRELFDVSAHPGRVAYELHFVLQMYLTKRATKPLVIDLSHLEEAGSVQRALISQLLNEMLTIRQQLARKDTFPVELVIDEAHRYLPDDQHNLADNGIFRLLREGRKAGLSLLITTQSTLDLPDRLRSQFATIVVHHLASVDELSYLHLQQLPTTQLTTGEVFLLHYGITPQQWWVKVPQWLIN